MRSTSSRAPAAPSMFERRSFAHSRCSPEKMYSGSDEAARLDELDEVAQVALVRAEVEEGIDGDHGVEELLGEWQTMRVHPQGKHARLALQLDRALAVLGGDVAPSAAQASIPNSRARKIELVALPQPRSRTRIPARSGRRRAKLSTWHRAFSPSALSRIHWGSYFAVSGNALGESAA